MAVLAETEGHSGSLRPGLRLRGAGNSKGDKLSALSGTAVDRQAVISFLTFCYTFMATGSGPERQAHGLSLAAPASRAGQGQGSRRKSRKSRNFFSPENPSLHLGCSGASELQRKRDLKGFLCVIHKPMPPRPAVGARVLLRLRWPLLSRCSLPWPWPCLPSTPPQLLPLLEKGAKNHWHPQKEKAVCVCVSVCYT